jgi:hypothetical protein
LSYIACADSYRSDWDFFTGPDPTQGLVSFVNKAEANSSRLAFVQPDDTVVLAVDTSNKLVNNNLRKSVRISTKDSYNQGLFIADFFAAPHGCGTWPAYWSLGDGPWPLHGEIDLLESIHNSQHNQVTLHTGPGCNWDQGATPLKTVSKIATQGKAFTGNVVGKTCASSDGDNTGCGVFSSDTHSFGSEFNKQAGGIIAHRMDSTGIAVWQFTREEVPQDIKDGKPNPATWPTPVAFFSSSGCDIGKHFQNHKLILDITLCGSWAGDPNAYAQSGCPGTCAEAVADPENFKFAQFKISSISVYDTA